MKLALKLEQVSCLRRVLGFILLIRRPCTFKFSPTDLTIISLEQDGPIIWSTISSSNFSRFDVIANNNVIGLEFNAEPLFHILKNYEKAPVTSELSLKLQREENTSNNKRKLVSLAVAYNEDVTSTTETRHSFSIPVNLSRNKYLDRLQPPPIRNVELIVELNMLLLPLFQRTERFKAIDMANIVTNRLGEMKIELQDDAKRMSVKWKGFLDTCVPEDFNSQPGNKNRELHPEKKNNSDTELSMIREITVRVKSKWWNNVSKLLEMSEMIQMHIHENGCVLNCSVEDEQSYSLLYFIPGKLLE